MCRTSRWILFAASLLVQAVAEPSPDAQVAAGRRVYLAEGCINCHSQYVRTIAPDVERWGPSRPLEESLAQTPPLLGNRRQGPDLQNVGNRRSREWERSHLVAPRRITPGSRMPSYAYLFADGDPRGDALLAYLGSRGADANSPREQWMPPSGAIAFDRVAQQRQFARWCAACHGDAGRGDGPLATQWSIRPRDLARDPWHFQPAATDVAAERGALARTIKYGVPGTPMAGHEYLSDADALALAAYVQSLRVARKTGANQS